MTQHLMSAAGMVAPSIINPLQPSGEGWKLIPTPQMPVQPNAVEVWKYKEKFAVISSVEMAEAEGVGSALELHYHVSISGAGRKRVDSNDATWVLSLFGMDGAEEDNHVPHGFVRNFWRPVNENRVGIECACKEDEPAIRENKGDFIWRPV
jgi:hypothetical protein